MINKSQEAKDLYARLSEETDSNILDVCIGSPMKPVFTVTIEGKNVPKDVLDTCRDFGYIRIKETKQFKYSLDIDTATKVIFYVGDNEIINTEDSFIIDLYMGE